MRKLFIVLLVGLLLCGCSQKAPVQDSDTPKQATVAVNTISEETLVDLIRLSLVRNADPNRAQYLAKLESLAQIAVTDYTEQTDLISATVAVSAPNMYAIATAMETESFTDATALDTDICSRLDSCEDYTTKTCQISFQYVEEEWSAVFTEEFLDALYGGLLSYRNEYLAEQEGQ